VTSLLEVTDLRKDYLLPRRRLFASRSVLRAVDGISFRINAGETLGLVGESGCGKSTTGQLLLRLIEPTAGAVRFEGTDLTGLTHAQLKPWRRHMQIVFQDPSGSLDPRMTVSAIIAEPLRVQGVRRAEAERQAAAMLDLVGLPRAAATRYPHQFSGGQRQRIGVARALALRPRFVVCDEATSALDVSVQAQIVNLLQDLQDELGLTYLFISHNLGVVHHIATRVAVMYLGRIVEEGDKRTLFAAPRHPYTRALIAAVPGRKAAQAPIQGDVSGQVGTGCRFSARCASAMPVCTAVDPPAVPTQDGGRVACHLHTPASMR
jgi:oligopeptide/dipeptide ABC transporter ATP-binding protein